MFGGDFVHEAFGGFGEGGAVCCHDQGHDDPFEADQGVLEGRGPGEPAAEEFLRLVFHGYGQDVGWRTLQHGDVFGLFRHDGQDGDGGCARADDDDFFIRVIEIFGPELRVNDVAAKLVDAWDIGFQRLRVVVVARAQQHEAALVRLLLFLLLGRLECPCSVGGRVFGVVHHGVEVNLLVNAILFCRRLDIVLDQVAFRDGLAGFPWSPGESKSVEI